MPTRSAGYGPAMTSASSDASSTAATDNGTVNSPLDGLEGSDWRLDPVFTVAVELGERDDDRIRHAVQERFELRYGDYVNVSFESAHGLQRYRGQPDSITTPMADETVRDVSVWRFSIPRDTEMLRQILDIVYDLHSYEEPVVHVVETHATRTRAGVDRETPNRGWNRP